MEKKTFYVITIESNGKCFSYAETIFNNNNLVGKFPKNATTINACDTKKQSEEIARYWNRLWKEQDKLSYEIKREY